MARFSFVFWIAWLVQLTNAQEREVLTSVEQIQDLKPEELLKNIPVDLECIVMCYEPEWPILFVNDGRNGMYAGNPKKLSLKPGDHIRIRGSMGANRFPVDCTYEQSNNGLELPIAKPVTFDWLFAGNEDSQFVEIEGQLIGITSEHQQICLEMRSENSERFRGLIRMTRIPWSTVEGMLGKKLLLRGVVGARFDEFQRWSGFQIWLSGSENIVELEAPGKPYVSPMTPLSGLTAEAVTETKSSYFRTAGVATYKLSPSMILVQDGAHQLFVELIDPSSCAMDLAYEVIGNLDTSIAPPILRMGVLKPSREAFSVRQVASINSIPQLLEGDFSGKLIRTMGTYFGPFETNGQHGFWMHSQGNLLPVFLDGQFSGDFASGTHVEVEGIWIQQKSLVGFNIGAHALHARKGNVRFGTQFPWAIVTVLCASGIATGLSGIWAVMLRTQVGRKTQQLQSLNVKLTEDLHARTVAEERLRTATTYLDVYRKIVDQHAMVTETDTAGTILSVNDAFCKISGYTREELIGQNHRKFCSGIHPIEMWKEMYRTIAGGGYWHSEICNRHKNGSLYWVDTTIAPLFNEIGEIRGYFAIRADITSLKEAQVQAESASRSKSEFLANMSHEIRTPMTAILGYADILADEPINGLISPTRSECIDTIKRNGEHLLSIINDILDISKIEADKMTAEQILVSPIQLVQEVVELMRVKSNAKGLELKTRWDATIPDVITTDPTRLRQILVNLVGNAIKFTEVGGVTISVRVKETDRSQIYFDVIDTGVGLTVAQAANLFRPFEQADTSMTRKYGGTGLGLRISKRLAEMLGGDITASSTLGRGCVFTASIATGRIDRFDSVESKPVPKMLELNEIQPTTGAGGPHPQSLVGSRILLVEDGPDNQHLIAFLLRKAGASVEILENGKLAVERFTADGTLDGELTHLHQIDLVLMDMQMPEIDGYEATRMLRSKGLTIPILALTAHAMDIEHANCLAAGCDLRLTKPIDKTTLIEACVSWIGRQRVAS